MHESVYINVISFSMWEPLCVECSNRIMCNDFKLQEIRLRLDIWKKFLTVRAVRHWNRLAAQRRHDCPIPGSIRGQTGCSFEQPDVVQGAPAHGRLLEPDGLNHSVILNYFSFFSIFQLSSIESHEDKITQDPVERKMRYPEFAFI